MISDTILKQHSSADDDSLMRERNNIRDMLESTGNLRPVTANIQTRPKTRRYRVRIQEESKSESTTFAPPRVRLRLDEAFDNAYRNKQTHIFTQSDLLAEQTQWKRKIAKTDEDAYKDMTRSTVTVAQLMKPERDPDPADQLARIKLRGEDSLNNRIRGQGSLTLKTIPKNESEDAARQDVHIRCAGDQALDNRDWGQRGTGVSALLTQNSTTELRSQPESNRRAVRSEEAADNWRRDRLKECTEMECVLNHGWSGQSAIRSRPTTTSIVEHVCQPPWNPVDTQLNQRPQTPNARGITRSGAANAFREGSAMADRMGLTRAAVQPHAHLDSDELNEMRDRALQSLDEPPARHGPKARFEGLEYAMRGRGTLNSGLIPSDYSETEKVAAPRLKGDDAHENAGANKGEHSKLLLSNWRLVPDPQPPIKPVPNSKNIRARSRGTEARSCLNPTRPKWSGKVHWKRRPPAPVKCTF
ncbi:unnamed protein product [Echinostoma caproni]|uniref:Uncharacterized protein n=1 Tax=Echinostoma caproni TaxID=27848 RepID=A0A183A8B8_9TREM|nr:unnamed protein product [Echinostoma caproni]